MTHSTDGRGASSCRVQCRRILAAACLTLFGQAAHAVDLMEVYELAQDYDATIQSAFHDFQSAQYNVPAVRSVFLPQLTFNALAGLTDFNSDQSSTYLDNTLQLSLSQTLYDRQSGALLEQAKIGVSQAEAQYAAAVQDLILRVATAYLDILRAEANVEFSQSELQAIARQREQAERRFDVGLVAVTDVRTAQAQYDLAVAQEIVASNSLETAREALRVISGVNAEQVSQLASDYPLVRPIPDNVENWVELAQATNLPLVIVRLSTDSARAAIKAERAQRYPTIRLTASASALNTEQDLRDRSAEAGEIGVQATLPIYSGGRINAEVAQAQANWRSATADLEAQERAAVQQARDGFRGVVASIAQVRALNQALVSTQQSADAVEAGFRAGTRTSVEVLNALRDVFQARADYANARYDYILSSFRLKSAAGTLGEADLRAVNRFLVD